MKLGFSLKNKEVNLEADVEKLVEKGMDIWERNPERKTRHQIKQEENRKNQEQKIQIVLICIGVFLALLIFALTMAILEGQGVV